MTSNLEAQRPDAHSRRFLKRFAWAIALVSAVQLGLVLFVLPKFDAIFEAMFSDRELPAISAAVVQFRWALAALACLLPFTGWLIARFVPIPRLSAIGLAIILAVVIAQIPATVIALFAPFISLVNSLSPK